MAVVSDDHADPSLAVEQSSALSSGVGVSDTPGQVREILMEEVSACDGRNGQAFYAVIDGWVVDASSFIDSHPGGLKKLLSANSAGTGWSGEPFGFSFARGRNAHFPSTGRDFRDGVQSYLEGAAGADGFLVPATINFKSYGSIKILGRLQK